MAREAMFADANGDTTCEADFVQVPEVRVAWHACSPLSRLDPINYYCLREYCDLFYQALTHHFKLKPPSTTCSLVNQSIELVEKEDRKTSRHPCDTACATSHHFSLARPSTSTNTTVDRTQKASRNPNTLDRAILSVDDLHRLHTATVTSRESVVRQLVFKYK
jgi:hypothetical protein